MAIEKRCQSRRDWLRRAGRNGLSACAWAGAGWLLPLPLRAASAPYFERRHLMGTAVDITVAQGPSMAVAEAAAAAFAEMSRLAAMMSRHDPDSLLSALNRDAGRRERTVTPEMMAVLQSALEVSARSRGAFDIRIGRLTPGPGGWQGTAVPDEQDVNRVLICIKKSSFKLDLIKRTAYIEDAGIQLDLGGIAKLPILAAGMGTLAARGYQGVMINGGGDVLASARADGRAWRIGLRDPARPQSLCGVLPLHQGVAASSGDYERFVMHQGRRYHHIVDPRNGRPTQGVAGVTLVADHLHQVNGLGCAVMAAGPHGGPGCSHSC